MYSGGRSDKAREIWWVRIQGTSFRGLSAHSRKASVYICTAIMHTNVDTTVMALHCPRITCHAPDGHRNELLQTFVSQADTHILTPVVQFKVMFLCTCCEVFAL